MEKVLCIKTWPPQVKTRKYAWFWGDKIIHLSFYNGCVWVNRFWSTIKIKKTFVSKIILHNYILYKGDPTYIRYLQISNIAHENLLILDQSLGILYFLLWSKINIKSQLDEIKSMEHKWNNFSKQLVQDKRPFLEKKFNLAQL